MLLGSNKQLGKISEIGDLKVGEDEIKRVRKTKYLGLIIDETMSWNQQYKIVKRRVKGGFDYIRKLRQMLPQSKLFQVYQALMESHLRYGNIIWDYLPATRLNKLQRLQDRAIALIHSAPIKDRMPSATLSVHISIKLDQAVMVRKFLNGQCPQVLKQTFTKRSQVSKYETRRSDDLQVPRTRLEITKKSFSYKVPRCGMRPNNIRNLDSVAAFKKQAENYFLGQGNIEDPRT